MGQIIIETPQAETRLYVIKDETIAEEFSRDIDSALSSFRVVNGRLNGSLKVNENSKPSIADFQDLPTDEYTPLEKEAIRAGRAVNKIMREQR